MQRNPLNANAPVANVKTTSSQFETYDGGVLTKCKVEFNPIQDLHGYDNPWVGGAGKNLLPPKSGSTITTQGITFTFNADETIRITGTPTETYTYGAIYGANSVNISLLSPLLTGLSASGNMALTIEGNAVGVGLIAQFNRSNGTLIGSRFTESELATTVPSDAEYMFVAIRVNANDITAPIDCTVKAQITNRDVAESWTPYSNICPISGHTEVQVKNNSTTYTINLGGTYYEGTLDVATGELKATRAYIKVSSVESVAVDGGIYYWKVKTGLSSTNGANAISSHFKSVYSAAPGNCYITASGAQLLAIPYDQTLNTLAAANTWCAANQPEFCYTLATPTTIKILPTYINSNVGMNTVSCPLSDQYISMDGIEYKDVFDYKDIKYSEAANVSRQIGYEHESPITMDLSGIPNGVYFVIAKALYFDYAHFAVISKHNTSILILTQTSSAFSASGTDLSYAGDWYSNVYLKDATGYIFYG